MSPGDFSLVELRDALARRTLSATDVTRAALDQIRNRDAGLGAFVHVDADGALARAAAIDREGPSGPLGGVPIALKDNLCTTDMPTTASSRILRGYVPPYDATVVNRLRAAGAVIVGKTNCDEFAMGSSTENSAYHVSRNPWDPTRTPGGSSGGSAVAVAAGFVPGALGSDTGGSIRQPAALCGLVGFKPTYGRVSRFGLLAFASSLDQIGPLTRTVADAALLAETIAGADPNDATAAPLEVPRFTRVAPSAAGLRVGVPRSLIGEGVDGEVRALFDRSLAELEQLGGTLVDIDLPHASWAIPVYYLVATAEASSNLARYDGVRYGHRTSSPGTLQAMYNRTRDEGFGPEVKRRIMLGTRPQCGLLRRLLLEGAAGADADSTGLRGGVRGGGRGGDADEPDAGIPPRREGRRSPADVPGRRLHGQRKPDRAAGHQCAVRVYRGRLAGWPAVDGPRVRRDHPVRGGRGVRSGNRLVEAATASYAGIGRRVIALITK